MLKFYVESVKRLSTDKDGVVSFEYVIVAACIVGAVAAAFGTVLVASDGADHGITAVTTSHAVGLTSEGALDVPMPHLF